MPVDQYEQINCCYLRKKKVGCNIRTKEMKLLYSTCQMNAIIYNGTEVNYNGIHPLLWISRREKQVNEGFVQKNRFWVF
jgi:hypothetical protein